MKIRDFKKEIKIYFKHQETVNNRPVYKLLIDRFVAAGVTGCTIIKSNFGYGVDMKIVYPDNLLNEIWNRESTIIITVIETESKLDEIIKIIDETTNKSSSSKSNIFYYANREIFYKNSNHIYNMYY
jgi:PII-like signaling protein